MIEEQKLLPIFKIDTSGGPVSRSSKMVADDSFSLKTLFPLIHSFVAKQEELEDEETQSEERDIYTSEKKFDTAVESVAYLIENNNSLLELSHVSMERQNDLLREIIEAYSHARTTKHKKESGFITKKNIGESLRKKISEEKKVSRPIEEKTTKPIEEKAAELVEKKVIEEKSTRPAEEKAIKEKARYKWNEKTQRWQDTANKNRFIKQEEAARLELKKPSEIIEPAAESPKPTETISVAKPEVVPQKGLLKRALGTLGEVTTHAINKIAIPAMAAYACWESYQQITALDDKDPDYKKNVTKIIGELIGRFGLTTVATILGTIAAGAVSGPGAIVGFLGGLSAGLAADYMLGDTTDQIVDALIDKVFSVATPVEKIKDVSDVGRPEDLPTNIKDLIIDERQKNVTEKESKVNDLTLDATKITLDSKETNDQTPGTFFGHLAKTITSGVEAVQTSVTKAVTVAATAVGDVSSALGFGDVTTRTVGKEEIGSAQRVVDFFTSRGWTREQALGIAGNISAESGFKTNAVNPTSGMQGIVQWDGHRRGNFAKKFGKSVKESSFDEQLEFIQYELTSGEETNAGRLLKQTKTPEEAAYIFEKAYERSGGQILSKRIRDAKSFAAQIPAGVTKGVQLSQSSTSDQAAATSSKNINMNVPVPIPASSPISMQKNTIGVDDVSIAKRLTQTLIAA